MFFASASESLPSFQTPNWGILVQGFLTPFDKNQRWTGSFPPPSSDSRRCQSPRYPVPPPREILSALLVLGSCPSKHFARKDGRFSLRRNSPLLAFKPYAPSSYAHLALTFRGFIPSPNRPGRAGFKPTRPVRALGVFHLSGFLSVATACNTLQASFLAAYFLATKTANWLDRRTRLRSFACPRQGISLY